MSVLRVRAGWLAVRSGRHSVPRHLLAHAGRTYAAPAPAGDEAVGAAAAEAEAEARDIDIFAAAIAGPATSTAFPEWYAQMCAKLASGAGPVSFAGTPHPFPYNPDFCPVPPLSNELREQLVALWASDRTTWTPRKLAGRFGVSIERAKAVIKLKTLEQRMVQEGFRVNKKYLSRIESALGARPPASAEAPDRARCSLVDNTPPRLVAVPEEAALTAQEAAQLLGRRLRPIFAMVDASVQGTVPYEPFPKDPQPGSRPDLSIQIDGWERSRWRFVFVDPSPEAPPSRSVYVREPSGELRYADEAERAVEARRASRQIAPRSTAKFT